jgi:hypothetical protein
MRFGFMRVMAASNWTERKSELQECEWSGQLVDSGSTFEKALMLVGAKPAHCFTKGSRGVGWMLGGFTFAPLPSARKAKEDEKQKEMKGLQESGGAGD